MLTYRLGDIVLVAALDDPQGRNPKDRPALIVGVLDDPAREVLIEVMAITTLIPNPVPR